MFYNVTTKPISAFPDELSLTRRIVQTVRGLQLNTRHTNLDLEFLLPVDHLDQYLTAEQVLLRLRKLVGANTQVHIKEPRMFLHEVRDSNSIGLATLYSRYVRSLMANCLRRLNPVNDYVSVIQCGEYNCLYFANAIQNDDDNVTIQVKALLCPHIEPDWALDDFCRREIQLYQHDLYGDRGKPSFEEFIVNEGLEEYTDDELREYAYLRNTFATHISWERLSRAATYTLLYSYQWQDNKRPNMLQASRLGILPRRINFVTQPEAYYWFRFVGRSHSVAMQDSRREIYRSLLLTDVREYLDNAP